MPWWRTSSSKYVKKKTYKESFIDTLQWKFKTPTEEKVNTRSGAYRRHNSDIVLEKGSLSRPVYRSPSPSNSNQVSRCQSSAERGLAQPLPLPGAHPSSIGRTDSGICVQRRRSEKRPETSLLPHPKPTCISNTRDPADADADLGTGSVSSGSSIDSDDSADYRHLSPQAVDFENGSRTIASSPSSKLHKDQSPVIIRKNSEESLGPVNPMFNNQSLSRSPRQRSLSEYPPTVQIPQHSAFANVPDRSVSSPSRSPMRKFSSEQIASSAFWAAKLYPDIGFLGSGYSSNSGSGQNCGHNSMGGDASGHLFWQQSNGSPECSPIPSPRMTSPVSSSRIHSGAVTPLHPWAGGVTTETSVNWPDDGKRQNVRLPLPWYNYSHFSPSSSTAPTSPAAPRSPRRAENPTSPGSQWKKGRLIGRDTFGHVCVGFNSESSEMCAMKEAMPFDDVKSSKSAERLGQHLSPRSVDFENESRTVASSPSSTLHKNGSVVDVHPNITLAQVMRMNMKVHEEQMNALHAIRQDIDDIQAILKRNRME